MDRSLTWQSGKPSVGDDCVMSRADRSDIAVVIAKQPLGQLRFADDAYQQGIVYCHILLLFLFDNL